MTTSSYKTRATLAKHWDNTLTYQERLAKSSEGKSTEGVDLANVNSFGYVQIKGED